MSAPNASGFNQAMGIFICGLGIMIGFIGIMGLISEGLRDIGWLMLALAVSGVLMIIGGWQMFSQGRADAKTQDRIATAARKGQAAAALPDVLGEWVLDATTWKAFCINEKKYRNSDNIWFFVAFLFLGTAVLMLERNSTLFMAALITGALGLITVLIRRSVALSKLQVPDGMPLSVTISRRHIVMNGKMYPINADRMTTRKVRLITDSTPVILELTIYWPVRQGETFDELRIPVPPDAIEKAREVVSILDPHANLNNSTT